MAGRLRAPEEIVPAARLLGNAGIAAEAVLLVDLLPQIATTEGAMQYAAERGLIGNAKACERCQAPCRRVREPTCNDGSAWRCPDCRIKKSIRDGSFFTGSHLSLRRHILFLYMWREDMPLDIIKRQTGILNDCTMADWANMLREVCSQHLIADFLPLGGFNDVGGPVIVEIDETKFFHRKYHRANWREGHWVFGAVERDPGRCLMEVVANRDRATLDPIISRWLLQGTHIISDGWAAYNHLELLDNGVYLHDVIIHDQHFVDPVLPWLHTNTIEGEWMHTKRKLIRQCGTGRNMLPGYLDEFMWRCDVGPNKFGEIINSIRRFYPV